MTSVRTRYLMVCLAALLLPALAFALLPPDALPGPAAQVLAVLACLAAIGWVLQAHVRGAGGWAAVPPMRLWLMAMGMILSIALLAVAGLAMMALLMPVTPAAMQG